jgi:pSer/pThr/pTyr-binding forkhead associated (FHA) protein
MGSQALGPYLEVLESVTRMPPIIDLTAVEHRIGRSPAQADIVFENDITVSRLHASIILENEVYRIYDEGSTSGTWINEQAVTNKGHTLKDGDEIRLGAAVLRYRLP